MATDLLQAFFTFVTVGHIDAVAQLVRSGDIADINCRDAHGFTPLIHAGERGHGSIVHFLIGCGADLQASNIEGSTALHMAAYMGRLNTVELLVSAGAEVNAIDVRGGTPLASASRSERISREHTAVVTFLVKNGARISRDDATAALYIAAQKDLRGMVKPLVDAGAVIDHVGSDHKTPLILASWLGQVGVVEALLAEGASIDLAPGDGRTALHWAVQAEHVAVIKALVRHGASVMARNAKHATPLLHACCLDKPRAAAAIVDTLKQLGKKTELTAVVKDLAGDGCTPLHMACRKGSLNIVRLLVANEASLSEKMTDTLVKLEGATPLSIAVRHGFLAITKCLVDAGADVIAKDDKGYTPVDLAVEMDNVELTKALLKRGRPDPRDSAWDGSVQKALMTAAMRDNKGLVDLLIAFPVIGENETTSLIRAAFNRLAGLVSRLVAQGENVDARDTNGNTALHHVVAHGDAITAGALLDKGADPNSIGQNGWTPLITACVKGHETLVELLLTRGASINYLEPNNGFTALDYAVSRGHIHIVERLVRSGASVHSSEACQSTPLLFACFLSNVAAVYAIINTLKLWAKLPQSLR